MADVQKQFKKFIDTIRLGTTDEEKTLRDKRDQVLEALRDGLRENFKDSEEPTPTFANFNQGSYSIRTGIKPVDENADYDIDVGIVMDIDKADHAANPVKPKIWVRDALDGRIDNTTVTIKTPCVTVTFDDGCHVDLAVYADPDKKTRGELPLSWGKENASNKEWQTNHPSRLEALIEETFPNQDDRAQFRRVIRALKRWRDLKYKSQTSHAAPVGVGLTVAGLVWPTRFQPQRSVFHGTEDDRKALELFVRSLLDNFRNGQYGDKDDESGRRLVVTLPFAPDKDVFARITNRNMEVLESKLKDLLADIEEARDAESNKDACACMRRQFGKDFPEGEDEETEDTEKSSIKKAGLISAYGGG